MSNFIVKCAVAFDPVNGNYMFDFDTAAKQDVVELTEVVMRPSKIFNHAYLYGYEFRQGLPYGLRSEFINQIKGLSKTKMNPAQLEKFLTKPIQLLGPKLDKIDCVIYPVSERSPINYSIIRYLGRYALTDNYVKLELAKKEPAGIKFDFEAFERENKGYLSKIKYDNLLDKAKNLIEKINGQTGYFSLSASIKPVIFRRYIKNYLEFKNTSLNYIAEAVGHKNILLVDDICTSQATIMEALKIIKRIAAPKKITIFTVMGNNYSHL
jgi:hypothetical protein